MTAMQLADDLRRQGIPSTPNEPLSSHTSFQIGGPAALFCTPKTPAQLAAALRAARRSGVPCYVLGRGTNVLFCDEGYHGLVLCTEAALLGVQVEDGRLVAGAGESLEAVCLAALQHGLSGLEFAYGIPGSVGGAVYMNAGAFGGEMCDVLHSVRYLDEEGEERCIAAQDLCLGYRQSIFQQRPGCVLSAAFALRAGDKEKVQAAMQAHMDARRAKQPLEYPSAGSAFKRPEGAFAGELIDRSGLRGYRVGGAAVSQKHCGFIVNLGGATCKDVLAVADHVVDTVRQKTGFALEKEIRVVPPGPALQ